MRLHQLPNGDWIDLRTITSIRYAPRETGYSGMIHAPRIIVEAGPIFCRIIDFESNEDAQAARDELANLVNQ